MTRIAVFGDVHGNSAATAAVLADIDAHSVDAKYCLGDLVGYGARPNETIDLIRERNIPTIIGNYDDGVGFDRDDCGCAYQDAGEHERGQQSLFWSRAHTSDEHKLYLQALPFDIQFDAHRFRVRLVHGSPRKVNEYVFEDRDQRSLEHIARSGECDVLVFGHTHQPWTRTIADVVMVNAGSVGKPKDGDWRACWVLLEIMEVGSIEVTFKRVEYDVAAMAQAIREVEGLPDHFARDIETGGAGA